MNCPDSNEVIILQDATGVFNIFGDFKEIMICSSLVTLNLMGSNNSVFILQSQVEIGIVGNFNKITTQQTKINARFVGYENELKSYDPQNLKNTNLASIDGSQNKISYYQKVQENQTHQEDLLQKDSEGQLEVSFQNKENRSLCCCSNFSKECSQEQTNQGEEQDFRDICFTQYKNMEGFEEFQEALKVKNIFRFGKNHWEFTGNLNIEEQICQQNFKITEHKGPSKICSACCNIISEGEDKMIESSCQQIHIYCITEWLNRQTYRPITLKN